MSVNRIVAAAAIVLASSAAAPAFAHAKLQSSDPRAGSTLAGAPRQVRLKFNETLEPAFSKITVVAAGNKEVAVSGAGVDRQDPTVMTATLPALSAGEYRIRWSAMTRDSHKTKGEVPFTVK